MLELLPDPKPNRGVHWCLALHEDGIEATSPGAHAFVREDEFRTRLRLLATRSFGHLRIEPLPRGIVLSTEDTARLCAWLGRTRYLALVAFQRTRHALVLGALLLLMNLSTQAALPPEAALAERTSTLLGVAVSAGFIVSGIWGRWRPSRGLLLFEAGVMAFMAIRLLATWPSARWMGIGFAVLCAWTAWGALGQWCIIGGLPERAAPSPAPPAELPVA